ncbi:hypothetical protein [Chitinimonas lacunae]|uniref:Uncharacterized protein n=1 Tax=Chitinimonas lacunae TaxID=1963018 RepID=A0ABV8MK96_9NEIS
MIPLNRKLVDQARQWINHPSQSMPQILKALGADEQVQRLATPIGDLPREAMPELSLPLLDAGRQIQTDDAGWSWDAVVGNSVRLDIDLLDEAQQRQLGIEPALDHLLLCYGAALELKASLTGTQQIGAWGSVEPKAGANGNARIDWFIEGSKGDRLIEAITDASEYWLLPTDLQGLLERVGDNRFRGLSMSMQGDLYVSLAAGAAASAAGWTYGLDGDKAQLGLSLSARAEARLQLAGDYRLRVQPELHHGIKGLRVVLNLGSGHSGDFSLKLNAGLDLSGLTDSAEQVLRAAWPAAQGARLDSLTRPGQGVRDLLRQRLLQEIDSDRLKDLVTLLIGGHSTWEQREQLVTRLTDTLADELDQALGGLANGSADPDGLTERLTRRLLDKAAGKLKETLSARLRPLVSEAINEAGERLGQAMDKLARNLEEEGPARKQLLASLGELGARLSPMPPQAAAAWEAPIRQELARYAASREELIESLTIAQRAKLKLALGLEWQSSRYAGQMLSIWFAPGMACHEARQLYLALCGGRLALLDDLLRQAEAAGAVQDADGWLLAGFRRMSQARIGIDLLGFSFENSQLLLTDAHLQADRAGRLLVAKAQAQAQTTVNNPWKHRCVQLGVVADLSRHPESGTPTLSLELLGAFTAAGEKTDRRSVQHLLDQLAGAMGVHNRLDLRMLLAIPDDQEMGAKHFWRDLALVLPLELSATQWERFCAHSSPVIQATFLKYGRRCLDLYYADRKPFAHESPTAVIHQHAEVALAGIADMAALDETGRLLRYLSLYPDHYVSVADPDLSLAARVGFPDVVASGGYHIDENLRFGVVHRLAVVVRSGDKLAQASRALQQALDPTRAHDRPEALLRQLEPHLKNMRNALAAVAVASQTFTAKGLLGAADEGLSWPFTTFILAMAELTGMPVPPGFLPIAIWPGRPEVMLTLRENG